MHYGNHKMLSIDDKFLSHVDTKRMNWYLDRDLAVMINDKDFKLTFKSKGDAERGKYYKLELESRCVVCGSDENLTKHHVVPLQYRKYFPIEYKSKSSFDVLCLCANCHNEYELYADKLKSELLAKYNLTNHNKKLIKAKTFHHTLNHHSEHISDDRRGKMVEFLEDYFDTPIEEILLNDDFELEPTTSLFMKNITDYKSFIIMWRKHFIENTAPEFLPQEWEDEINLIFKG
tara:strand:- start:3335 stop:4030 length:696 start_codon:yes stop_codon:yes gene_type:complete